jgi:uncharacterized protein (TIGR02271 family)
MAPTLHRTGRLLLGTKERSAPMPNRTDQKRRRQPQPEPPLAPGRTLRERAPRQVAPGVASKGDIVSAEVLDARQRVEVPIVEEQISVEKRTFETGQVVVHVEPVVERQELEVPLLEETVEVERVAVNRFVDAPLPVRQEGDVTIVPVFEEVLVVEKRLMLKEEIRLVRRKVATRERRSFDVRKEQVHVLRADGPGAKS